MFFTYEIQPGESLEVIAGRFQTSVPDILAVNDIPDPTRVRVRTIIRIPMPIIPPTIPSPRPFRNFSSRLIGNTLLVFSTDRSFYRRNQPVRLTLIKTNISSRPVTLTYNTAQRFDFFVRRGLNGPVIWQWSANRSFAQVVGRVNLEPGQSQIFSATWNQRTNAGREVGAGMYAIQAENTARELRGRRVSLFIRIV